MNVKTGLACVAVLREEGVDLDAGLTQDEIRDVEDDFGFVFRQDHADLLRLALPVGERWVDWRGRTGELRGRLAGPIEGVIFDVQHNAFWPKSWGPRPEVDVEAVNTARSKLVAWPKLIPVFSHRYTPAAPAPFGAPVFSVHQTDVIHYGADLLDYFQREFGSRRGHVERVAHPVDPWSSLAMGHDDVNL